MPSERALDLLRGVEDLSALLPQWLNPLYWAVIFLICLLAAIMQTGQDYVASLNSTAKSTVSLVLFDSLAYFTLTLSALLLAVAALLSKPWESISPAFLGPMAGFLASCVFAHAMKLHERRILTLWLRTSSMIIVNDAEVDLDGLAAAMSSATRPPQEQTVDTEDAVIALLRLDHPGGLPMAASSKGSQRPFVNAIMTWWRQGSAQQLPHTYVSRRVNGRVVRSRVPRTVTHADAVMRLMKAGRQMVQDRLSDAPSPQKRRVKLASAFSRTSRHVVHAKYGNIWMRVSKQPGLDKASEGWWFIGSEIVQSLKAASGIQSISGPGRYEDVSILWDWVEDLGYGWRKEYQIRDIAQELAKGQKEDEDVVANCAMALAGLESYENDPTESELHVAREANCVAALGLAVKANVAQLESQVDDFCSRMTDSLLNSDPAFVGRTASNAPSVVAIPPSAWPEHDLALLIVDWISTGASAGGRPQAPAPVVASMSSPVPIS